MAALLLNGTTAVIISRLTLCIVNIYCSGTNMESKHKTYKISCSLVGHEQDVRALAPVFKPEGGIISGSRDKTARLWIPNEYVKTGVYYVHSGILTDLY